MGSDGAPVQSASVNVQGTTIGAYTNEEGRFTLNNVPSGAQVLVVRRIGYRRGTAPLPATQDQADIRLERDVLELERQVITGTTTTISSANVANAVAVVSGEELNRAPTPTVENALQGKIPGAVITTNSGAPGGGSQVQLRGITSINASSSPLYVVDGVLVANNVIGTGLNSITNAGAGITNSQDQAVNRIADLNPGDIETIEILKGASAGAIYGSKASNGVIVITTRRGSSGRPTVNFTQRLGQFSIAKKLGSRCFGSAAEYVSWTGDTAPAAVAADIAQYNALSANGKCHDYEQEFYSGNPLSYETNLSVRGGNQATSFYVGGLAKRDNAIQRNTYYQKQSITANISQVIGSHLTVRSNNEFVHSLTDRGISGNDNSPVVSPVDIISSTPSFFDMQAKVNGQYQPNPFLSEGTNMFQTADLVTNPEDVYRYIGSVNSTYSAYTSQRQTLDFTIIGGVDAYQFNSKLFSPPAAFYESADGLPGTIVTNKSSSVNANLNLSGAHKLILDNATATTSFGLRQERRQIDVIYNQARNIPAGVTNIQYGIVQTPQERQELVKDFAYYAQEEVLTLGERLFLTAAVNAERSSVNGDDKKFYAYPKFAASYRLPYLPRYVDGIKVRLAYGKAGNQPPYGFKFTTLPYTIYDAQPALRTSTILGNPNIKPETSAETEGGVDIDFLGGRGRLEATLFRKTVSDLIVTAAQAPTTGFTQRYINGGGLKNTGTEITLNLVPVQTERFSWISRTTFGKVNGIYTSLDVPGFNCGAFFSLRYGAPYCAAGYSTTAAQVYNGYDTTWANPTARTGYVSRARHIDVVESAPSFTMGFSNEFSAGNFRLYGLLDWRKGGYVANLTNNYFDGADLAADTALSHARYLAYRRGFNVYFEKATFLKLRELTLSYLVPKTLSQAAFSGLAQDVRLELSGRNLKTWSPYTGYDPEVSNFGNQNVGRFQDVTPYPPSRSVFFSLGATF